MPRKNIQKISVKDWANIAIRYRKGHALNDLARRFSYSVHSLRWFVEHWGIKRAKGPGSKNYKRRTIQLLLPFSNKDD